MSTQFLEPKDVKFVPFIKPKLRQATLDEFWELVD